MESFFSWGIQASNFSQLNFVARQITGATRLLLLTLADEVLPWITGAEYKRAASTVTLVVWQSDRKTGVGLYVYIRGFIGWLKIGSTVNRNRNRNNRLTFCQPIDNRLAYSRNITNKSSGSINKVCRKWPPHFHDYKIT